MPHSWNTYCPMPERRWFQRCVNCKKRAITGMYFELYDLASDSCNGQCKSDCCHGWGWGCESCTIEVAGGIIDRMHESKKADETAWLMRSRQVSKRHPLSPLGVCLTCGDHKIGHWKWIAFEPDEVT